MKGKIPIRTAETIADRYGCQAVIVFGLHDGGAHFCVTTYGQTKGLCRWAATLGEQIADKILDGTIAPEPTPRDAPEVPTEWEGKKR